MILVTFQKDKPPIVEVKSDKQILKEARDKKR